MIACAYGQYRQIGGKLTHITASVFNLVMNNLGQWNKMFYWCLYGLRTLLCLLYVIAIYFSLFYLKFICEYQM